MNIHFNCFAITYDKNNKICIHQPGSLKQHIAKTEKLTACHSIGNISFFSILQFKNFVNFYFFTIKTINIIVVFLVV